MALLLDQDGALHQQVYRALRAEILSYRLTPGERLPSTRALAKSLRISRNTAVLAYEQLLAEGYAQARLGSGTIVAPKIPEEWATSTLQSKGWSAARPSEPHLARAGTRALSIARQRKIGWDLNPPHLPFDFRFGRPAFGDFPHAVWCRLLGRRARRASFRDLDYGPPEGRGELREVLAERLRRLRGIEASPEQVVIVNGSQQALDLIGRTLVDPDDRVLIEEPHYLGARSAFLSAGAHLIGAAVDQDGMQVPNPNSQGQVPRLVYVTPSHQFPTGVVMPLSRRLELLSWAAGANAFVVEDDYDSEYRYEGRPVQALAGLDQQRVIYVGTFSKLMFPALRLGYLVLPKLLVAPIVACKAIADTGTATLEQLTLADFIGEGHFERHLHRSTARNRVLRGVLLQAIHDNCGTRAEICGANAGLHLLTWLDHPNGARVDDVERKAAKLGVGLYSVAPYYFKPPERTGVLLGYGPLREREIREGIKRLAGLLV